METLTMKSKEQAFIISLIIIVAMLVGLVIGFNIGKRVINNKSMDMDIECEYGKEYCVLEDLDFYDRINEPFFRAITNGKGLCGTINLPNSSSLNMIYCGDNLDITLE